MNLTLYEILTAWESDFHSPDKADIAFLTGNFIFSRLGSLPLEHQIDFNANSRWSLATFILLKIEGNSTKAVRQDQYMALNYCALAAQLMLFGFLSYAQGHVGVLQPQFLPAPCKEIHLLGIGTKASAQLVATLLHFTCMSGVVGCPVLVWRTSSQITK